MTFYKILIITLALLVARATAASVTPFPQKKSQVKTESPLKIEPHGLVPLDGLIIDDRNPAFELKCPFEQCVVKNPSYKERLTKSKESRYRKTIKDNIIYTWFKDDKPILDRENANRVDEYFHGSVLVLYQPGQSDQGRYRCEFDYSKVPLEQDMVEQFEFCRAIEFELTVAEYIPDIVSIITSPPMDKIVRTGESVTWFCNQTSTLSSPTTYWFKSCQFKDEACIRKFELAINKSIRQQDIKDLDSFIIWESVNQLSLTIENVTEDKTGHYGCATKNLKGVDIRSARLELYEQIFHDLAMPPLSLTERPSKGPIDWIWLAIGMAAFCVPAIVITSFVYLFRRSVLQQKKQNAPLIQSGAGKDTDSNDWNSRRRLPNIEAPDIYNTGKSRQGFITGHFHQPTGHMMTQSVCSKLLDKTTPSISSANSQQSDETSHPWSKSPYTSSSSTTATNVQMYDHPPSTGTLFFHGACISNPTYGLLRPDNEVYMLARQLEHLVISENDYTELDPEHAYYNVNAVEV